MSQSEPDATQNNAADDLPPHAKPDDEVWSYRGYHLKHSEFTSAMVHLFRAEITRANVWRMRLDMTTNWAVISTGAALSLAFSEQTAHHSVIILSTLLVTIFLFIEARRYRYYEMWSLRVRQLEINFFAAMLVPPFEPRKDWAKKLADSLTHPEFPISLWEALGRRLRRNYMWMYLLLALAWILKVALFPQAAASWQEFFTRAAIGAVPGWMVLIFGLVFNGMLFALGLMTRHLTEATGEVLPELEHYNGPFTPYWS